MKKCMSATMNGEVAYTLKDIELNEGIKASKLRTDIKNNILKISGKTQKAYYITQSQLDRYLSIINQTISLTDRQIKEMRHTLGLDYGKKPYRNRFYCQNDNDLWNDLVGKGLANKGSEVSENNHGIFWLTCEGVAFILGRSISVDEYKEL